MIFLSTYRNKRRWIAAAGMTIWLMSAYVGMLDEIPGTVCVSDGQPLNITEGLPVTSQIRSTDGIAVSAGMMTGGRYEVECKLFGLIPVKEVTVHIVEETEVIPCGYSAISHRDYLTASAISFISFAFCSTVSVILTPPSILASS